MEEYVRNRILLAALEDGLDTVFVVIVLLVLGAHAAGSGVQHHIHALAQLLKAAGHRDVLRREGRGIGAVHQIQIVLDAVGADHIVFPQSLNGQGGCQIGDTDQLHVLLHCHAVCQTLSDGAVTGNTNFNLCHICFLHFRSCRDSKRKRFL